MATMNKSYCGDAFELLPRFPDNSVDLILTDPPYGTTNCKWDTPIDLGTWWEETLRVAKENAPIVVFCTQPFTSRLVASNFPLFKYCWVWDKTFGRGHLVAKYRPMQQTEDIAVFGRGRITYFPKEEEREKPVMAKEAGRTEIMGGTKNKNHTGQVLTTKQPTNLVTYKPVHNSKAHHPTEKPIELLQYLIDTYSSVGDIVLDPFMGSGSTGVACALTGRKFVGVELDEKFYDIAVRRVEHGEE